MRLFQFHACYPAYYADFARRFPAAAGTCYKERLRLLQADRFNAVHWLEPIVQGDPDAVLAYANDPELQGMWARDHDLASTAPVEVLLAQIEEHRTEVLYALHPMPPFDSAFVRRLPGCVRKTVCWRAAPSGRADLAAYHLRVCNFPHILKAWRDAGLRSALLSPSYDPAMESSDRPGDRDVDVAFIGSYTLAHRRRNRVLERAAALEGFRVVLALQAPAGRPLVDLPLLRRFCPLPGLPKALRDVAIPPVYGQEMYGLLQRARVVLNAAIDMSDEFRGNMRCFEAMGCGACMVSDAGVYPDGFEPGTHLLTYRSADEAVDVIQATLKAADQGRTVGRAGRELLRTRFSKARQWADFQAALAAL